MAYNAFTLGDFIVLVSLLGFCLGTTLGWSSPMEPLLTSPNPPVGTESLTLDDIGWLCSVNFLGTMVGALFWGSAADQLGRKATSCLVAFPHILSWTLILNARDYNWLLIGRFIAGIGTSGTSVTVPPFISEIAQDDLRGTLGCFLTILINLGVLFSYVTGAYLEYHIFTFSCLMVPVFFLFIICCFPETPMFLWRAGKIEESKSSLLWYRGGNGLDMEEVLSKYKSIQINHDDKPSLRSLFSVRGTRKAILIAIAMILSVQLSGFFSILSFSVNIFESSGTSFTPSQSAIVVAVVLVTFSCFCSVLIDRIGRRFLLIGSLITISLSLATLGLYLFLFDDRTEDSVLDWIPIVCISLHVTAFATGLGPIHYVINGEIFPPEIRGYALSIVSLVNGALAFVVVKMFPILKESLNLYGCFWFYSAFCLFFSIFFAIYLPETRGKPQNEILDMLNKDSSTMRKEKFNNEFRLSLKNEFISTKL